LSYGPSIWQQALNSNAQVATRKGFSGCPVDPRLQTQILMPQVFR